MKNQQKIDALKSCGHYREAGILAAACGQDRRYGCHFGLRSDLNAAQAEFYAGFESFISIQFLAIKCATTVIRA